MQGSSVITLQFELSRDIDGAAGDVQAAINAASGVLPKELPNPPTYKKVNPAEKPVFILGLTSNVMSLPELDQYADLNLAQRISMLPGIAQVVIFGEQKYAPTVQLNPTEMAARSIGIDDVATAITNNTLEAAGRRVAGLGAGLSDRRQRAVAADRPVEPGHRRLPQRRAGAHQRHRPGRRRLRCPAAARLGQQPHRRDDRHLAAAGVEHACRSSTTSRPMLPAFEAGMPPSIKLIVVSDRSLSISASFTDVKLTLCFTVVLVVLVIFLFLRSFWATVIPSVTVPLSLLGTFADPLFLRRQPRQSVADGPDPWLSASSSTMRSSCSKTSTATSNRATIALTAALKGAGEIGFTIVSITISLIAVFIPVLFMGGIVGRLFREFGVTVSVAIVLSAIIALTLSPMMASLFLVDPRSVKHGRLYQWSEWAFERTLHGYQRTLRGVLQFRLWAMLFNLALIALTGWLVVEIPKGFIPEEDTGIIFGFTKGSPDVSFMGLADLQQRAAAVIMHDPDVVSVGSAIGGGASSGQQHRPPVHLAEALGSSARRANSRSSTDCGRSWPRFPASRPTCSRSKRSRSAAG